MKRLILLSNDKDLKKGLSSKLKELHPNEIDVSTVSNRGDMISELIVREFDAVFIHCDLPQKELEIILKYLSTNEYYDRTIFFVSEKFDVFNDILKQINFPKIGLITLPMAPEGLADKVSIGLFPRDTSKVDNKFQISLEFLKVFIEASKKVFIEFCGLTDVTHQAPYLLSKSNATTFAVLGKIPLNSETFEGTFHIGFEEKYYLELIKRVILIESDTISPQVLDFAAELVNMIYGQAKIILNQSGYDFQKVIPSFELNPARVFGDFNVIVVPINTEFGTYHIEVEVKKIKGFAIKKSS